LYIEFMSDSFQYFKYRSALLLISTGILLLTISSSIFAQTQLGKPSISPYGDEAFNAVQEFFRYDLTIPLNAKTVIQEDKGNYLLEKFVFTTSDKSRVSGLLAIPKLNRKSYPCMILIHSGTGRKEDWWAEDGWIRGKSFTEKLLQSGYAVLAIDADGHGERSINYDYVPLTGLAYESKEVYSITKLLVQTTIDHRRAYDYLKTKTSIDSSRIGVMGYSLGGMVSTYLCTQLPDLKVAVLCASGKEVPFCSPAVFPMHFAPRIKDIPVLLLDGKDDNLFPASQVEDFGKLLKTKHKLIFYESGHLLPVKYLEDAYEWIRLYLK
jgi:dienelactone hydrolase